MRIQNYVTANEVNLRDKLLGTGYLTGNTQNYSIEDLIAIVLENIADPQVSLSVQADWAQTNTTATNYIKNKPNIYSLPVGTFYRTKGFNSSGVANTANGLERGDVIAGVWEPTKRYTMARYNGGDVSNFSNYSEMVGWQINY